MKILFNCSVPFSLAHGGLQIQIEQTQAALEKVGITVEPLRWWDEAQTGDVLHHFGRIPLLLLRMAQQKGLKVVMAELLTEQGSRPPAKLALQRAITWTLRRKLPRSFANAFSWDSYVLADACLALTPWEAHLMNYLFEAPPGKTHVVPNGVEETFLNSQPAARGKWLVCTATITDRKRVLELAEAAAQAHTPVWIIGKPYAESDPYAQRFLRLAKAQPEFIRYEGPIRDRAKLAQIYREARGFVLLSAMESLSLSALEAAACECPLLLSDLPWARTVFQERASYSPVTPSVAQTAQSVRDFYEATPHLPIAPKPLSWIQVANQLKTIYEGLLNTSR